MAKLTLDDIVDLRAYERERDEFRAHIIELKKRRRVSVGPVVTVLFENSETVRFQIQEMARAEKTVTDEGIETELRVYNPLVPEPGNLAATMFIELTSDEQLRHWLPKLAGVERAVVLKLGDIGDAEPVLTVTNSLDPEHEKQLTRDEVTAAVHYIHFALSPAEVDRFAAGPVALAVAHPEYEHEVVLGPDTVAELLRDLRVGG